MASNKFTEKTARALLPRDYVYKKSAGDPPGFHIVVTPTGHKTWYLDYTSPETGDRVPAHKLGVYVTAAHERDDPPVTTLADARDEAMRLRSMTGKGIDPRELEKRNEAAKLAEEEGTFGNLIDLYIDSLRAKKAASTDQVKAALDKVTGDYLKRPADPDKSGGVTENDVMLMMAMARKNAQKSGSKNAQKSGSKGDRNSDLIYGYIHAAYEFARKAKNQEKWRKQAAPFKTIRINPCADIQRSQTSTTPGENMLEAEDVRFIWNKVGVEALSLDLALYIKLALALGGQRVLELLHAEWKEFDEQEMLWSIPMDRRKIRHKAKHREPHIVPLTAFSVALLNQLRELSGGKYLFPDRTGKKPRSPDALNQGITRFCNPQGDSQREPFKNFSGRDLRRTWKTLSGKAGVSKEVRDRIQGHAFSDVASAHYDRYDYLKEKRQGMEQWTRWLEQLVTGQSAKVVQIKGGSNAG